MIFNVIKIIKKIEKSNRQMSTTVAENKTVSLVFILFNYAIKKIILTLFLKILPFYHKLFLETRQIGVAKKQKSAIRGIDCKNG